MNLDRWVGPYKVRAFPWINPEKIYCNVQYYAEGQSIERPPVWEKTVCITNDDAGRRLILEFTHSFVEHVARMQIPDYTEVVITAKSEGVLV